MLLYFCTYSQLTFKSIQKNKRKIFAMRILRLEIGSAFKLTVYI